MAKEWSKIGDQIMAQIGGAENVESVYHCITRLRFHLKDETIARQNKAAIQQIDGVLSVVEANNQFQIVIGNDVEKVFTPLMEKYSLKNTLDKGPDDQAATTEKQGNYLIRFFNVLSSIFNPIIMPLAGAGMIKALLVVLTTYHLMDAKSSTYAILAATGNSVFYFLPLFLAISAARVYKVNPFIALAIVGALLEPNFTSLVTQNGVKVQFLGIPTILMSYSGTVIPAIAAIFLYAYLEKFLKRLVPKSLEIFLLPMLALLIMVPLTVMLIGPLGVILGDGLGNAMNLISERSGILAGLLIGGGWTFLVMIGIHWGIVPIMVNNLATHGYDILRPMIAAATFASAGSALGVFFRTKDQKVKSLALSSLVPALLGGITEPIVYGLSVRFKKPLIAQVIAGGIAGAFMGGFQVKAIVYVFPALTTLPAFFGATFVKYLLGITIAFVLAAVLTYMLGLDDATSKEAIPKEAAALEPTLTEEMVVDQIVEVPVTGNMRPIETATDPVFASKTMGDGVVVWPESDTLFAPVSGRVATVFPTKHALGFVSHSGIEVLIHIGIDTVALQGQYFHLKVEPNQWVEKGQKIGEFEREAIEAAGYSLETMVVITNSATGIPFTIQDRNGEKRYFSTKLTKEED